MQTNRRTRTASISDAPPIQLPAALVDGLNERIEQGTLKLPLLPDVPMQVSRLASDDSGDARAIAEVIARDQSMAAHLLRLVNSPLYRGKVPVVTVQQAVARLGSRKVREAAMLIACEAGVFRVRGFEDEVRQQFQHSVACALFAQEIARLRRANVEEAFLTGLMHDVGQPVLLQTLIDLRHELGIDAEREAFLAGAYGPHAMAGAALCASWDMSARVIDAIEQHHAATPLPSVSELVRMVQLADVLAHHALEPEETPLPLVSSHVALAELELYPDDLSFVLARADQIRAAAQAIG